MINSSPSPHRCAASQELIDGEACTNNDFKLAYPRGSIIPCLVEVKNQDAEIVESGSAPIEPCVRLIRKLRIHVPGESGVLNSCTSELHTSRTIISEAHWKLLDDRQPLSDGAEGEQSASTLYGELSLPDKLTPSFRFGRFEVLV